jgi:hypothetical protein
MHGNGTAASWEPAKDARKNDIVDGRAVDRMEKVTGGQHEETSA